MRLAPGPLCRRPSAPVRNHGAALDRSADPASRGSLRSCRCGSLPRLRSLRRLALAVLAAPARGRDVSVGALADAAVLQHGRLPPRSRATAPVAAGGLLGGAPAAARRPRARMIAAF